MSVPQSIVEWTAPELTTEQGHTAADPFEVFWKAEPEEPCSAAGVEAHGEIHTSGSLTVYRMINGSVKMCE